jgi:hypothetical protein
MWKVNLDISFLNAKAVIIEGTGELKDHDVNNSFAKKMYERYVLVRMLSNPMAQFSVNLLRYILVVKGH